MSEYRYTTSHDSNNDCEADHEHDNSSSSEDDNDSPAVHDNITIERSISENIQLYTMDLEAELTPMPSILTSFHSAQNDVATRQRQNSFSNSESKVPPIGSSSSDNNSKHPHLNEVQNPVVGVVPFQERHRYEFYTVIAGGVLLAFNSGLINGITLQARNVPVSHISGKSQPI